MEPAVDALRCAEPHETACEHIRMERTDALRVMLVFFRRWIRFSDTPKALVPA
jgi:hypothetical protein